MILICLAIIAGAGIYVAKQAPDCSGTGAISGAIGIISAVLVVAGSVTMVSNRFSDASKIAEIDALRDTLAQARESGEEGERYAVMMKVIDANAWLASRQYYNRSIFGDWVLDEVESITPIQ